MNIKDVVIQERNEIENIRFHLNNREQYNRRRCPHESLLKKHRANTGNYDPSANSYWTEFTCLDCGKFWTEKGSV